MRACVCSWQGKEGYERSYEEAEALFKSMGKSDGFGRDVLLSIQLEGGRGWLNRKLESR